MYLNMIRLSGYSELEGLIVSKESSHEWSITDWDGSRLVNIIMSPGLSPVETEVFGKSITCKSFLGGEDGGSKSFSLGLVKSENTVWSSFFIFSICIFSGIFSEFSFGGEILNGGSHELIISVSLEIKWNFSFVTSMTVVSWEEIFLLNEIVIRVRVGG